MAGSSTEIAGKMNSPFDQLVADLARFVSEREWSQFHTPKNLSMALAGEAGELVSLMQWLDNDEVERGLQEGLRERLEEEMADVLLYLLLLARATGTDLLDAGAKKLHANSERYTVPLSRGNAVKQPPVDSEPVDDLDR